MIESSWFQTKMQVLTEENTINPGKIIPAHQYHYTNGLHFLPEKW